MEINQLELGVNSQTMMTWFQDNVANKEFSIPLMKGVSGTLHLNVIDFGNIVKSSADNSIFILQPNMVIQFKNDELSFDVEALLQIHIKLVDVASQGEFSPPFEIESLQWMPSSQLNFGGFRTSIHQTLNQLFDEHWREWWTHIQKKVDVFIQTEWAKYIVSSWWSDQYFSFNWEHLTADSHSLLVNSYSSSQQSGHPLAVELRTSECLQLLNKLGLPSFEIQNREFVIVDVQVIDTNLFEIKIESTDGKIILRTNLRLYLRTNQLYLRVEDIQLLNGGVIQRTIFKLFKDLIVTKIESKSIALQEIWDLKQKEIQTSYPFIDLQTINEIEVSKLDIDPNQTSIRCSFTVE